MKYLLFIIVLFFYISCKTEVKKKDIKPHDSKYVTREYVLEHPFGSSSNNVMVAFHRELLKDTPDSEWVYDEKGSGRGNGLLYVRKKIEINMKKGEQNYQPMYEYRKVVLVVHFVTGSKVTTKSIMALDEGTKLYRPMMGVQVANNYEWEHIRYVTISKKPLPEKYIIASSTFIN